MLFFLKKFKKVHFYVDISFQVLYNRSQEVRGNTKTKEHFNLKGK